MQYVGIYKPKLNNIHNLDCVEGMRHLDNDSVDLTVTSPPYDDMRKYKGYSWNFEETAKELYRVTKPGGFVVWIVADATKNGSETGTSFKQALFFKEIGFWLYDTMIWEKTGRIPTQDRYYNIFEYMFIFSKGKPATLNLIEDVKTTAGGRRQRKDKVINKGQCVKSDEFFIRKEYGRRPNIWKINIGQNPTGHPAPFPEQLAKDHILSWSNPGDIVLDPFMGSGTTAKMAMITGRNYIGFEISAEYCELAEKRLEACWDEMEEAKENAKI